MSERLRNTLREERERRGWSQTRMAEAAGITRQSYAAIEAGGAVPSTEVALRLAHALGRPVEDLFRIPDDRPRLRRASWAGATPAWPGGRVRLTRIAGRWVAHPVDEAHRPSAVADGVVEGIDGDDVAIRPLPAAPPTAALAVVGCDPAFGIVAERLRRERGIEVAWSARGSRGALTALARGQAHVAGVHLRDDATGEDNTAWVRSLVPFPCTRIRFAVWQQGLLLRSDRRRSITRVADLARRGVRIVNREEGSGSRMLLDGELRAAGIEASAVAGYRTSAKSHHAVAEAVAAGVADTGVAIRAVAVACGLDFLPLREEPYELVVPDHFLDLPAVGALLDALRHAATQRQIEALQGYDVRGIGLPA